MNNFEIRSAERQYACTQWISSGAPLQKMDPLRQIDHWLNEHRLSTGFRETPYHLLYQEFGGTTTGLTALDPVPAAMVPAQLQLAFIRTVLGLSITQMARLLHVSRQTIYNWVGDADETLPAMLEAHRERVFALYGAAQLWANDYSPNGAKPGRYLSQKLVDSRSLRDLLSAERIDWNELQKAFRAVRASLVRQSAQQSRKTAQIDLSSFPDAPPETRYGTHARLKLTRG